MEPGVSHFHAFIIGIKTQHFFFQKSERALLSGHFKQILTECRCFNVHPMLSILQNFPSLYIWNVFVTSSGKGC
jgi:hypothetical protein